MPSNVYTCNGCGKTLLFDDYPPVGNLSTGFTYPECSKHAKKIAAEVEARLLLCGEDGEMVKDLHTYGLTPTQISEKYSCTIEEVLQRVELCITYISGEKRKDISYQDWVRKQTSS